LDTQAINIKELCARVVGITLDGEELITRGSVDFCIGFASGVLCICKGTRTGLQFKTIKVLDQGNKVYLQYTLD
jgi:hypothetical protein